MVPDPGVFRPERRFPRVTGFLVNVFSATPRPALRQKTLVFFEVLPVPTPHVTAFFETLLDVHEQVVRLRAFLSA